MKQIGERNIALDVIRCVAMFCVNAVHYFSYQGLYWVPVEGMRMFWLMVVRNGLMVCVPLFLLLSGYLMGSKTVSRKHYLGVFRTYGIYVLASLVTIVGYHIFNIVYMKERVSITGQLLGIFSFTTIPYSWYVEMYIGLFLLIPFLNILYQNVPTKKGKQLLIAVLLFLTAAPSVLNVHNFRDAGWWLMPSSSEEYNALVPSFWVDLYPISYYFIGCYLREYPVKMRKRTNLLLILAATLVSGGFTYYRSYGGNFIWGIWQDMESLFIVAQGVLVFIFLVQRDYSRLGARTRKLLAKVSGLSLGAYLTSWIWEQYVYSYIPWHGTPLTEWHGFLLVPMVFVGSVVTSGVITWGYDFCAARVKAVREKSRK